MRECTKCQALLNISAVFCPKCGEKAPETDGQRRKRILTDRVALSFQFRFNEARLSVLVAKLALGHASLEAVDRQLDALGQLYGQIEANAKEEAELIQKQIERGRP